MAALRSLLPFLAGAALAAPVAAQKSGEWARADTLRGSLTASERTWWDVTFYDLRVRVSPKDSSIRGSNRISYRVLEPGTVLQVDLKQPLEVDSMVQDGHAVPFRRDGDAFFVTLPAAPMAGDMKTLAVHYHGRPQPAKRPPWDGGFSWGSDSLGRPWVVTTDQGVGASIWWPNKDTQADEPDSQRVAITVPKPMVNVSNGRLRSTKRHKDGTVTYEWLVTNPINNYAIAVAAGSYAHWSETYDGEAGKLTLDFWPLDYHLAAAKRQWVQVRPMLQCFEHWFGPYPWYEDGYKLVEVSNNGMEHQSAVSYGNGFANGYRGRDWSQTGLGMEWDFIIVHESAHEWWGNNITTKDLADMWVHESFANYAEGIYTECLLGKEAGARYVIGNRNWIKNDRPVVPAAYGVNAQGSGDMYPKGGQMLHTIRQLVQDDAKWRDILRGLNRTFRHRTVTGAEVQDYMSAHAGIDLSKVFAQYLTTTRIPTLEYRATGDTLSYRWADVVPGFDMAVDVAAGVGGWVRLRPTETWQATALPGATPATFRVNPDFYVIARAVTP
jgi:aminopeptidase N